RKNKEIYIKNHQRLNLANSLLSKKSWFNTDIGKREGKMEPSPDAHSFTHRRRSRTRGPWEDHASGQDQRHLRRRPRTWPDHPVDWRQPYPSSNHNQDLWTPPNHI